MRPSWLLARLVVLALTIARPAQACATCGCGDPTLVSIGAEQPFGGRFRAFSEGQVRTEASGTPQTGGTSLTEWALNFGGSYAFSTRWALSVTVPVLFRTLESADLSQDHSTNLGDIEALGKVVLWRDRDFAARHLFSLLGGMRFPTAPLQRLPDGTVLTSDIQAGPGAWWFIGGASYYGRLGGPWSVYTSVLAYLPTKGREGLEPAPSGRGTVHVQVQPWSWMSFRLGTDMRLDGVWHENGEVSPDTGGFIAFLSPAVLISPATDWLIQVSARFPVINALKGVHTEGTYASISLVVDL